MPLSYALYTGNGTTKDFVFSFPYLSQAHLKVYLDGVVQASGWSLVTPTGPVRFTVAPANGAAIRIQRETPLGVGDRPVVFENGAGINETDLNDAFLQNLYAQQEIEDRKEQTLRFPSTESAPGALPAKTQRSLKVLEFDEQGNPVTARTVSDIVDEATELGADYASAAAEAAQTATEKAAEVVSAAEAAETAKALAQAAAATAAAYQAKLEVGTIGNLRALSVSNLNDGDVVVVRGHGAAGDGGGGSFYRIAASSATDDGGLVIAPTVGTGRWVRLMDGNAISVRWFGARGNGVTDDRPAFLAAFTAAATFGYTVRVPAGEYLISSIINMDAVAFNFPLRVVGEPGTVILGKGLLRVRKDGAGVTKTLAANVAAGSRTLQLTDNAGVQAGHLLFLRTVNQANTSQVVHDQLVQVRAVNGDGTLTITPVKFPFPVTLAFSASTVVTQVTHFPVATDLHFERITFKSVLLNSFNSGSNMFQWIDQFVGRLSIIDCGHTATLEARQVTDEGMYYLPGVCIGRHLIGSRISGGFYETTGYTFWFQWGGNTLITNLSLRNQRHAVTTNNTHDILVSNIISQGGGVLDSHGSWDVFASNIKSTGTPDLNNIRSNGTVTLKDCDLDGDVALGASSYLWYGYIANAADIAWYNTNIRSRAYCHVENCIIRGKLTPGGIVSGYRFRDVRLGSMGPLEVYFANTAHSLLSGVIWDNVRGLDGVQWNYSDPSSRSVVPSVNPSNPLNHAQTWFIPAASASSGRDTFVALIDAHSMNVGRNLMPFVADFARHGRLVVGSGVTKQITVCLLLSKSGNDWPCVGAGGTPSTDASFQQSGVAYSQNNHDIFLNAYGSINHANSTGVNAHVFRDQADFSKFGSFRDFTYNAPGYKVLTVAAYRKATGTTALPAEIVAQVPAGSTADLLRYEIDINVVVTQTGSTLALSFDGFVQRHV